MVRIDAFQALGPGSIPGKLKIIFCLYSLAVERWSRKPKVGSSNLPRGLLLLKQSGAVEACLAHNQEVDGSKPSSAILINLPAPVAKWIRRLTSNQKTVGSIPTGGKFINFKLMLN